MIIHQVEELRQEVIDIATYEFKNRPAYEPALEQITGAVDTLISLAEARGEARGRAKAVLPKSYGDALPIKEKP